MMYSHVRYGRHGGPTGAEVLALVSGLSLHFGCFWSSLCGTTLYSQPQWKQLAGSRPDSTIRLDLHLGSTSSSSSSLSPSPSPPSSSVIHLNPYTHLRSIRQKIVAEETQHRLQLRAHQIKTTPSLASKKRCNENNGQQECAKPGLGVFHEAQEVRL